LNNAGTKTIKGVLIMAIRCIVRPENGTEILCTLDGRHPSEDDYDFGADFFWAGNEIRVIKAVSEIVATINDALAKG
jgi:hypothetical protein